HGEGAVRDVSGSNSLLGVRSYAHRRQLLGDFFEGLAVSPDGSGVVFEVTDELGYLNIPGATPLPPEEKGFFFVRADGSGGPQKIGDPSRVPPYSSVTRAPPCVGPVVTYGCYRLGVPSIAFSPDGQWIVFTDVGPGPAGEEAQQIVTID